MTCKKIGIDFHGVINSNPDFFRSLLTLFVNDDYKIYIVSGGPREYIEKYLKEYNIPYSEIWCIFDHFDARNQVTFLPDGSFHVDNFLWDSAKGKYCRGNNISFQIDDSPIYGKYFSTPYIMFDTETQSFEVNNKKLSTKDDLKEIYQQLRIIG